MNRLYQSDRWNESQRNLYRSQERKFVINMFNNISRTKNLAPSVIVHFKFPRYFKDCSEHNEKPWKSNVKIIKTENLWHFPSIFCFPFRHIERESRRQSFSDLDYDANFLKIHCVGHGKTWWENCFPPRKHFNALIESFPFVGWNFLDYFTRVRDLLCQRLSAGI